MPNIVFNYGNWNYWSVYDPANDLYGNQKVVFDGINKIIFVSEGVTELDVGEDVYSGWKEWIKDPAHQNAQYKKAFTTIGGDPITDEQNVGVTYFLENGWRIQPAAVGKSYVLTVNGNIYTRETGGSPFLFAEGVSVSLVRSNIVDIIRVEALGVNITEADIAAIAAASAQDVWDEIIDLARNQSAREKLRKISTKTQDIALR